MLKFKIGDTVVIDEFSEFYWKETEENSTNPINIEGRIINISSYNLPIIVDWSNGKQNSYAEKDLKLIKN